MDSKGTSEREPSSGARGPLSLNLPPGFDPAAEMARAKDEADQSYAPQHQSAEAVEASGNVEERARYLSFVDGPTQGAHADAIARHGKFGDFSINNGGGAITEVNGITAREREEEEDKERADELGEQLSDLEEKRREQSERWQSQMRQAGIDLSEEEWDEVSGTLADPAKRERLRQNLMQKKGWSAERTDKAILGADELRRIYEKTKAGTATDADLDRAKEIVAENPDTKTVVEAAAQQKGQQLNVDRNAVGGKQQESVDQGSDLLAGDPVPARVTKTSPSKADAARANNGEKLFASAPDLTAHHSAAVVATVPLDAPKSAAPIVVASAPAPDAGGLAV